MPKSALWKTLPASLSASLPGGVLIGVLILVVAVLSLPVMTELARSLAILFGRQSGVSFAGLFLSPERIWLLTRSVGIAGVIGLVGVCMGIPLARIIGAGHAGRDGGDGHHWSRQLLPAILISPIWLPAAMVYAAGNLLRAPDTIIGKALVTYSTSSPDLRWITIWAGYAIAVVGLAIWSAPIAGVLIASGLGHRTNLYTEMIALEPVGLLRRSVLWVRLHLAILFRAWVLVAIIMLGSAVPMHLAQLDTWSIVIWRQLAESPIERWGSIWLSAWPTVIIAAVGAWVLTGALVRRGEESRFEDQGHSLQTLPKLVVLGAIVVWALGALVPMGAMLVTLDDWGAILHFWRIESQAMADSGVLALASGLVAMLVAMLIAMTLGNPSVRIRRIGAWALMILCILGLIPGVLIGAAVVRSPIPWLTTGWGGALLASCIRSAFLGAIIGALCARAESIERQSIRWQMSGGSITGWARAVLPGITLPLLGAGLIAGLYSMYEIEASVMVRPPGMDNLPQQLLADLHYARLEQLSAAGVNLLGIGLVGSIIASLLITRIRPAGRFGN